MNLPDIQKTKPTIMRSIKQVGVNGVEVMFKLEPFMKTDVYPDYYPILASTSIRTDLEADIKGISMSRLRQTLKPYLMNPLKHSVVKNILEDIAKNVETKNAYIRFDFKIPYYVKSPKTDNGDYTYVPCLFEGSLVDGKFRFYQGLLLQYASYCPCSAELSKDLETNNLGRGFPHNQRSFAKIMVEMNEGKYVYLEEIINGLYSVIPTIPYPIIKRPDEQEIARIAALHPIFVEDAIRIISDNLDTNESFRDWIVFCDHQESIHPSNAIAANWKGVDGGFDGSHLLFYN